MRLQYGYVLNIRKNDQEFDYEVLNQLQDEGVPDIHDDADDILLAMSPPMDNVHADYDDDGGCDGNNDDGGVTFDITNNKGYLGDIT